MKRPGFTLLEVILALTILAGAIAVLGEVNRLALRNASEARDLARAQLLAESKLAEIKAGITSTDLVDNAAFDPATESLDPAEPAWLFSISSQSTDEDGLIAVRVTVTRALPAGQHPVKFSLACWLPDPNYTSPNQTSNQNSGTGGSSTSGGS
jgi:type II secretion system protein I